MTLMSYRQKRRLIAPESKIIRRFVVASNALEQYLHQGGALNHSRVKRSGPLSCRS